MGCRARRRGTCGLVGVLDVQHAPRREHRDAWLSRASLCISSSGAFSRGRRVTTWLCPASRCGVALQPHGSRDGRSRRSARGRWTREWITRRWLRSFAEFSCAYVGAAALGVLGALLATGSGSNIFKTEFWRSSLFVGRPEYGFRPFHDGFDAGASFLRALVSYPPVRGLTTLREYFTVSSTGPRLLLHSSTTRWSDCWRSRRSCSCSGTDRGTTACGGLSGLPVRGLPPASSSAWWWDPSYVKYFLLPVLSWCFLLALSLTQSLRVGARSGRAILALTSVAVLALFVLQPHDDLFAATNRRANEWLAAARELKQSQPSSLFVSAGRHPLDFYVAYFAGRDVISSGLVRYASGSDADVARAVSERVRQHARVGGPIYVYGLGTVTPTERRALLRLLPGTGLRPAWRFPQLTVYLRTRG